MNIYEAIYSRKTVRDFTNREIEMDILKRILDASLHAPTNNQLYF